MTRIACLFADRPYAQKQQDLLLHTLFAGLVNVFGSVNVRDFPPSEPQYMGGPSYEVEWPVFSAAGCLKGKPLGTFKLDEADAYLINVRWLLDSVREGLHGDSEHVTMLEDIDQSKVILIDSSDAPSWKRMMEATCRLNHCPRLLVHRHGIADDFPFSDSNRGATADRSMVCHIAAPLFHILRMMANGDVYPCRTIRTYVAMNDNSKFRRQVIERLASSNLHDAVIRFGSGTGYKIDKTLPPIGPPYYYREIASSQMVCAARGGNRDTLRQSEVLALGRLLISDDPMWDPPLVPGKHYLIAETPDEFVSACWWAIDNRQEADYIAQTGHEFYLKEHTPERQAFSLIQKAGLLN